MQVASDLHGIVRERIATSPQRGESESRETKPKHKYSSQFAAADAGMGICLYGGLINGAQRLCY